VHQSRNGHFRAFAGRNEKETLILLLPQFFNLSVRFSEVIKFYSNSTPMPAKGLIALTGVRKDV
jgi:hypothetical protein